MSTVHITIPAIHRFRRRGRALAASLAVLAPMAAVILVLALTGPRTSVVGSAVVGGAAPCRPGVCAAVAPAAREPGVTEHVASGPAPDTQQPGVTEHASRPTPVTEHVSGPAPNTQEPGVTEHFTGLKP